MPTPTPTPSPTPTPTPTPTPAPGIQKVQQGAFDETYTDTVTLTLALPSTPGTLLVAAVGADGTNPIIGPPGWVKGPATSGSTVAEIWYYPRNPGGVTSASFSSSLSQATAGVLSEWSGAAAAPLEGSGSAVAGSTGSVTVRSANSVTGALVITSFAPFLDNGGALTVTGGASYRALARDGTTDWFHYAADYGLAMGPGFASETLSSSSLVDWTGVLAAFRSA